jgi:hypothetical protein
MTLSNKVPALLDDCAQVLMALRENNLDLTALFPTFYREGGADEIVATLVERVEGYSYGTRTVRRVVKTLFQREIKNTGLYLASCPIDTAKAVVTELNDDMTLVTLRPCGGGLAVGVERASYNNDVARLSLVLATYFESPR